MLQKALDQDPNLARALSLLVAYDLRAKQPEKAMARIQAQIAKSPQNGNFYDQLAVLQLEMRDLQGALASSQKAMQLNPQSSEPVQVYTQVEVNLGNTDAGISAWQTLDQRTPRTMAQRIPFSPRCWKPRATRPRAQGLYQKALQLDPNNWIAANNLAFLMIDSKQNVDVALSLAQTARRLKPESPQTADTLAWVYFFKGDYGAVP